MKTLKPSRSLSRALSACVYWGFAQHLPWSPRPGGRIAKSFRALLARWMLDECGRGVNVERHAWFGSGRGVQLGDRSAIGLDCMIIGPVTIGRDVMMGPRCMLIADAHSFKSIEEPMTRQGFAESKLILIEDDVWIGAGVIILPGRTIGTGSIIGAGSVVTKDVAPYSIVGGNPAALLRVRV